VQDPASRRQAPAVTRRTQLIWWGVAVLVAAALLWSVGGALAPYFTAAVLAYLLTPIVDRMERLGLGRVLPSLLVVGVVVVVLVGVVVAGVPLIYQQAEAFVMALPDYIETILEWLDEQAPAAVTDGAMTRDALTAAEEAVQEHGATVVAGLLAQTLRIIDVVVFLVILPIVTFFLILSWHEMIAAIDGLLPRRQAATIRRIARDMDAVLGGFVRGQFIVALIMTVYYSAALTATGLSYALAVGVVAGIGTLVPIVGATVGAVLAIGIALFQFWGEWGAILLVAGVYFGGQLVESNIITPRLVGQHVNLHPVWLLLAFSVFATLFGFVGILVAVPVAAVLGVLVRFAVERYRESDLHAGVPEEDPVLDVHGRPVIDPAGQPLKLRDRP
jgi:predicted PurR-regulated permease PerM